MPSMIQEAKLHQTLNILSPWLIMDSKPSELWEINFCCLKATLSLVLCYSSPNYENYFQATTVSSEKSAVNLIKDPCSVQFSSHSHVQFFMPHRLKHQVAKGLAFQPQHQSSNEYSALLSFRMEWLDCLAVQGTLKSLLQHHSLESSVLWLSAFL